MRRVFERTDSWFGDDKRRWGYVPALDPMDASDRPAVFPTERQLDHQRGWG